MRKIASLLVDIAFLSVASAGEFHWTGAADSRWGNAANWSEAAVPGTGDTAIFGTIASGASSTVTVGESCCGVLRITGAGAPAYTFVGATSSSSLTFDNHGYLEIDSAVTQDQTFTCDVACTFSSNQADSLAFTNLSSTACLKLKGGKWTSGGAASIFFGGSGPIALVGKDTDYAPSTFMVYTPTLVFSGNGTDQSWRPKGWHFVNSNNGAPYAIRIADGSEGLRAVDGGGDSRKIQTRWEANATIDGPGVIPGIIDNEGYPYSHQVCGGVTLTANAVYVSSGSSSKIPRFSNGVHFTRYPNGGEWADRVVILNATNTFTGPLMISGNAIVRAAKLGSANCAPTESNIGCGSEVAFLRSGGTLEYTGAGETFARGFYYHHGLERWTWSANGWDKGYTLGCVRNAGSGTLTLTGAIEAQETSEETTTAVLQGYPTNCLFKLDGASAPIVFEGSTVGTHKFAFETSGNVTLRTFPAAFTNLILTSSITMIDASLGEGSATVPELYVSENSSLRLPPNYVLDLGKLTLAAGKTLDFEMDDSVTVTIADASEGALPNVTVSGAPARCNASGRVLGSGTAWKSATDGAWSVAANWTDGLPGAEKPGRINLDGTFKVSLDSSETIGDFAAVGGGGKATVEVSGSLTTASGAHLSVGRGAAIEVVDGGSATFDNLGKLTIAGGGELKVSGGSMQIAGASAYDLGCIEPGVTSVLRTDGGSCLIKPLSTGVLAGSGFAFGGTAGKLMIQGTGSWFEKLYENPGTATSSFSGTAEFDVTNSSCMKFVSNGRHVFTDNARMFICRHNGWCCFMPCSDGGVCEFEFRDHAAFGSSDWMNYGNLCLGCPGSTMPNGVTRFIFDSDAEHYVRGLYAGAERTSLGEVIQKRGIVHVSWQGIMLGTAWEAYWIGNSRNRGIYRMQGGVLDVYGGGVLEDKNREFGILVGWGMYDGDSTKYTTQRFSGRFELDGGVMTNQVGIVAVGCGRADGEFVQRGGSFTLGTNWAARKEPKPSDKGTSGYPGVFVVGGFTGTGLWAVLNGVMNCTSDCEHMYVGGLALETLRSHTRRVAQGSNDGSDVLTAVPDDPSLTGVGRYEIVDGTVDSKGDLIVGAAGHGEVDIIGSNGAVTYRNLVLSNNVESVLSCTFDANGIKPLALTGTATVTDGAKLVVDVGAYAGKKGTHRILYAAGGMVGSFAHPEVSNEDASASTRGARVVQGPAGVSIVFPRGTLLVVR